MLDRTFLVLGRALLSAIFILSGFGKMMAFRGTVAGLASTGWPAASVFIAISIVIELGGGLMLLFGFKVRWAAVIMALWLIPVTFTFHNFWAFKGKPEYIGQQINFFKNVAISGGLLTAAAASAPARRAIPAGAQR
jgi:putative oxidoreductase